MKFRCGLCSLQPHQNFTRYKSFTITFHILQFTFYGFFHFLFFLKFLFFLFFLNFLYLRQPRLVNNPGSPELFIKNVDINDT